MSDYSCVLSTPVFGNANREATLAEQSSARLVAMRHGECFSLTLASPQSMYSSASNGTAIGLSLGA